MPAPGERVVKDFVLRPLQKPEEFRAVEEVQRAAWGLDEEPPVPVPVQRAMQDNGGLVIGAFADIHLAGFCLGFLGWDGTTLFHYSHMTAVRPEYQNHRLGFRLKSFQREQVMGQGLSLIRWTFDPLQSKNAMLNIRRLGATIDRYMVHYYGQMGSEVNRGLESDRVRVSWAVGTPAVEQRLQAASTDTAADLRRLDGTTPIVETDVSESGLRVPASVTEPSAARVNLEIPFDLAAIRTHEPAAVRSWRHATRDAFRSSLDGGYVVDDFAVVSQDHERRSYYFLSKPSAASPRPS